MTDTTHYVAHVKVEKVVLTERRDPGNGRPITPPVNDRQVGEVTTVVVKAPTLTQLKTRVSAHMDLVEDDVPMDPNRGTTR